MADGKISDDSSLAAADALGTAVIPIIQSGNKKIDLDALIDAICLLGASDLRDNANEYETLTQSGGAITLDFSSKRKAIVTVTGALTVSTSNLAAGRTKTLYIVSHASNSYSTTFPSWKNPGLAPPTSLVAGKAYRIDLHSTGTTDAGVIATISPTSPGGVPLVWSTPSNQTAYKNTPVTFSLSFTGGPVAGYVVVSATCSSGLITSGTMPGSLASGSDPNAGDQTNVASYVISPFAGGTPSSTPSLSITVTPNSMDLSTITLTTTVSDGQTSSTQYSYGTFYGDTEVQQISFNGSYTGNAYGRVQVMLPGGSADFNNDADASTIYSVMNSAIGAAYAPSVAGGNGSTTLTLTFNASGNSGTDVSEVTVSVEDEYTSLGTSYIMNDNMYGGTASIMKTQEGDGNTLADTWTITYSSGAVGWITVGDTILRVKYGGPDSGTYLISGIYYYLSASTGNITLSASDYSNYGSNLSLGDCKLGNPVSATVTTVTPGG